MTAGFELRDATAVAFVDLGGTRSTTWAEFDELVDRAAAELEGGGGAIGILSMNRVELFATIFGAVRAGRIVVPLNWHLRAEELRYIVGDAGIDVLYVDTPNIDLAAAVADGTGPSLRQWGSAAPVGSRRDAASRVGGVMLYSSGTSGRPKGVLRPAPSSIENFVGGLAAQGEWLGYERGGTHLVTGPLYHAAPLGHAAAALALGQTLVITDRFDPEDTLALVQRHAVTSVHLVPVMMLRLLRLAGEVRARYDLTSLSLVLHGAAPCPQWVKREMIGWVGPIVTEYYGATESPGSFKATSKEWLARPGTVGLPSPGLEVLIVGSADEPAPAGQIGTVYLRGPETPSYHGRAATTNEDRRDGFVTMGDIGWVDADGYLYLVDRRADVIVSGGVNVYTAEVESCLSEHHEVVDCSVFGIPDDEWGEQVKAAVVLAPGSTASERELIAWCKERIAGFKAPRSIDFHDELPRSDSGKILKRELRAPYWVHAGRQI